MGSFVNTKHASPVLGFLFFLEAIFFVPTDPILILYCIKQRERALFFATVATLGSVLGGITSYCIGFALWQTAGEQIIHNHLVNYVLSPKHFYSLSSRFQQNEWLAILIAGFTPVPYKAATLAAGFCKISFIPLTCHRRSDDDAPSNNFSSENFSCIIALNHKKQGSSRKN